MDRKDLLHMDEEEIGKDKPENLAGIIKNVYYMKLEQAHTIIILYMTILYTLSNTNSSWVQFFNILRQVSWGKYKFFIYFKIHFMETRNIKIIS